MLPPAFCWSCGGRGGGGGTSISSSCFIFFVRFQRIFPKSAKRLRPMHWEEGFGVGGEGGGMGQHYCLRGGRTDQCARTDHPIFLCLLMRHFSRRGRKRGGIGQNGHFPSQRETLKVTVCSIVLHTISCFSALFLDGNADGQVTTFFKAYNLKKV